MSEYGKIYQMKHIVTQSAAVKLFTADIDIFIQKLMYRYNLPCSENALNNIFNEMIFL